MSHSRNIARFLVPEGATLRDVAECINDNSTGIALIVDEHQRLLHTVTDGDIRRALLDGETLDRPIEVIYKAKNRYGQSIPVTAAPEVTYADACVLMREHNIRQLPLVDDMGKVCAVRVLDGPIKGTAPLRSAVIFAGGFGKRLSPLTDDLPKPMVPVGDRPVIEHIVNKLRKAGIRQVGITTHFRPELIQQHFGKGEEFGVDLSYIHEDQPLGTAGALGLLTRPTETTLVMNGDILSKINIQSIHDFHQEQAADITVAARHYEMSVPYGVLECDGPTVIGLQEKPSYQFFVNAGIYLLEPSAFTLIPDGTRFDMTDLIQAALDKGLRVATYPLVEYWIDIGRHADYAQAQRDFAAEVTNES